MASRATLKEAQELKREIEGRHAGINIRIVNNSGERRIGRKAAERKGFEIIGNPDPDEIMVMVKETRFDVLEVRSCRNCGKEILTAAIGELGGNECRECEEKRRGRQLKESHRRAEASRRSVEEMEWRDRWEESEYEY